jgi:predicted N-formylglutamate amidohydrolase
MMRNYIVTCEHATNAIPPNYKHLFEGAEGVLRSHRGWDPGAWEFAAALARQLNAPILGGTVSRLLVDMNREEENPEVFSVYTSVLSEDQRDWLLEKYHRDYRRKAELMLDGPMRLGRSVVHFSVHTFTPILNGVERDADVGILFDPAREREAELANAWMRAIEEREPTIRVKLNYPYFGTSDGLATWLRQRHDGQHYLGIEFELNHGPYHDNPEKWNYTCETVLSALRRTLMD